MFEVVKGRVRQKGWLRVNPENPHRWIYEDGSPFYPIGFQQGVGGYGGTVDTFLQSNATAADNSTASTLVVDRGPEQHILMRFEDLFGGAPDQIPPGSTIVSAETAGATTIALPSFAM